MISAYFPGFLGVRQGRKILGVFEVFLGFFFFEETKEKEDRENADFSKLRKLAILKPDNSLRAAKETPKRVPKQTCSKTPSF